MRGKAWFINALQGEARSIEHLNYGKETTFSFEIHADFNAKYISTPKDKLTFLN